MIDFLSYISYIVFSDQIAETCEACDRGRMPRLLLFLSETFFSKIYI